MISAAFVLALVGTAVTAVTIGAIGFAAVLYLTSPDGNQRETITKAIGEWIFPLYAVLQSCIAMLTTVALVVSRNVTRFVSLGPVKLIFITVPLVLYTVFYLSDGLMPDGNRVFLQVVSRAADIWFEVWLHSFNQVIWVLRLVFEAIVPIWNMFIFILTNTVEKFVTTVLGCATLPDARQALLNIVISPVMGSVELLSAFMKLFGPSSESGPPTQYDASDNLYTNTLDTDAAFNALVTTPLTHAQEAFSCACSDLQPIFKGVLLVLTAPNVQQLFMHVLNIPISWLQGLLQVTSPQHNYKPNFRPLYGHIKGALFQAGITGDVIIKQTMTAASKEINGARQDSQTVELLDVGGPFTAASHAVAGFASFALLPLGVIDLVWGTSTGPYEAFDISPVFTHWDAAASIFSANLGAASHYVATGHVPGAGSANELLHCPVREFDYTKGLIEAYGVPTECHCRYQSGFCGASSNGHCEVDGHCLCTNGAVNIVNGTNLSPCVQPCVQDQDCNSISTGGPNSGTCRAGRCSCNTGFKISVIDGLCHATGSVGTNDNLQTAQDVTEFYTSNGCIGTVVKNVGYSVPCAALHAMRAPMTLAYAAYEFARMQIFGITTMAHHKLRFSAVLERYVGANYPVAGVDSPGSCEQRKAGKRPGAFDDLNVDPDMCLCDLPSMVDKKAADMGPDLYAPWCQLPTFSVALEQFRGAQVYVGQFLGLQDYLPATALAQGWQSAAQAALAGNAPGFSRASRAVQRVGANRETGLLVALTGVGVAAARCALHAVPLLLDFFVELAEHGESEVMRPVNCETGFPPSLVMGTDDMAPFATFKLAQDAMHTLSSSCTGEVAPAACAGAKTWVHTQKGGGKHKDMDARQLAQLYQRWHDDMVAFTRCTAFTAKSFKIGNVLCANNDAEPAQGEISQSCQCNPDSPVTADSTCRALSRLPIAASVNNDLAHAKQGGFWNNFYVSLPTANRWTRGVAAYEPLLYEMQNSAVMVERAIAALHVQPNIQCDDPEEIYELTNVNLISTWYTDPGNGKIELRNALDGATYHADSGLITGRKNSQLNPCMPRTANSADVVCPIYGHYQLPCALGGLVTQSREQVVQNVRTYVADGVAVLGGDLQSFSIDRVPMLCAYSRWLGFASSAVGTVMGLGGALDRGVTRQMSRATAQLLYSGLDYTFTSWLLAMNIGRSLLSQLISDATSINDGTVLSWVLVGIDFQASRACEILLGLEEFFDALGAGSGFLRSVRALIATVFQYINAEILSFLIVPVRLVTHFFTFVFTGQPSFGEVVQDLLLVVGKIIQFVLHNVFKVISASALARLHGIVSNSLPHLFSATRTDIRGRHVNSSWNRSDDRAVRQHRVPGSVRVPAYHRGRYAGSTRVFALGKH